MYQSLDLFSTAIDMAKRAGARQAVVAGNIANADTPGYRAKTLPAFAESYRDQAALSPRRSRVGHIGALDAGSGVRLQNRTGQAAPNGNTVSLETEMTAAAEVSQEQARAISVYRHALGIIRTTLG